MELAELASLLGALGMVLAGFMVIKEKSLVYASVYLAVAATFNAGLIALLGYAVVAIFQVAVYVGAAVLFIIVAVTFMGEPARPESRNLLYAVTVFVLGFTSFVALLLKVTNEISLASTARVSFPEVLNVFQTRYLLPVIIAFIALAAILIEATVLAKRDVEEGEKFGG